MNLRVTFLFFLIVQTSAQNLTQSQISNVKARLADGAKASWELGARAQALLEHDAPEFSVFASQLPPPQPVPSDLQSALSPVFDIARNVISNRAQSNNNARGPQPLMQDGSAADPASIGVAVLLANWTRQGGNDYAGAAKDQLDFLYQRVPRSSEGALSHRVDSVQLWSDFMYMVPPFLAYYGVQTQNESLISDAYNQIKLYRDELRDTKANNLWKHIVAPNGGSSDSGHWSTGNGWAAAGMLRVLATIQNSEYSDDFKDEQGDLADWISEIHGGMYSHLDSTNIFTNYADVPNGSSGSFYDCSSTALLAATVYRLSLLRDVHHFLPKAEASRKAIYANRSDGSLQHFTQDGWLTPVVNPHAFGEEGQDSPESQAFVLEMDAAWNAWVADGSKGANGVSGGPQPLTPMTTFMMMLLVARMTLMEL
ncbi:glycoside hydrolase family 105 protein [Moniliophthora roreri]|uniref:Putative glycoside hydrolase family 105 protein n=1 Tax=Moniliophthora roreri TaxID=221103 RepID=A0A0W0EXU4_MONRR|nr:glycoside hydrolase family 105 protein [Moniliophthora roreri]